MSQSRGAVCVVVGSRSVVGDGSATAGLSVAWAKIARTSRETGSRARRRGGRGWLSVGMLSCGLWVGCLGGMVMEGIRDDEVVGGGSRGLK